MTLPGNARGHSLRFFISTFSEENDVADLTNEATLERASEGQPEPASEPKSQTGKQGKQDTGKVNLHEFEDFRKYQAERDRREAQIQQQYQSDLQASNRAIADLKRQLNELADKDLDDFGKLQNQLKREQQEKQEIIALYQQREQEQRVQQEKATFMGRLYRDYELTRDEYDQIWQASSPDEAVAMARKFDRARARQRDEEDEERRESNRVDVGGGRASTRETRQSSSEREAWDKRDPQAFVRALREQNRRK